MLVAKTPFGSGKARTTFGASAGGSTGNRKRSVVSADKSTLIAVIVHHASP
jgi:hypothetical protein